MKIVRALTFTVYFLFTQNKDFKVSSIIGINVTIRVYIGKISTVKVF